MKSEPTKKQYVFGPSSSIGEADAMNDDQYLYECFVDNGVYSTVMNVTSNKFIIAGRTGVGKTALIQKLLRDRPGNHLVIDPQQLALTHVENSDIINRLIDMEVSIDIFFQALWQHIISIEILKRHYGIGSESAAWKFVNNLKTWISPNRTKALAYLEKHGPTFWQETEPRVISMTRKLEEAVAANIGAAAPEALRIGANVGTILSNEEKREYENKLKRVVGPELISELSEIQSIIFEIFEKPHNTLYITIDDLDLRFASERVRIKLVRALIDCLKKLHRARHLKFVVAMRDDLLAEAFRTTPDTLQQLEKYEDFLLPIRWNADQLFELVDRRIVELHKKKAGIDKQGFYQIFPKEVNQKKTREYMISRTLMRPRDLIKFVNACFEKSQGKSSVSVSHLKEAEVSYSRSRRDALVQEWQGYFHGISFYLGTLEGMNQSFFFSELTDSKSGRLDETALNLMGKKSTADDLYTLADQIVDHPELKIELLKSVLDRLFLVGVIGVREYEGASYQWTNTSWRGIQKIKWHDGVRIQIHKAYLASLGSKPDHD